MGRSSAIALKSIGCFVAWIAVSVIHLSSPTPAMSAQNDVSQFENIVGEMTAIDAEFFTALGQKKTPEERERIKTARVMKMQSLAIRCFELANTTSDVRTEIAALMWAADRSSSSEVGSKAHERLVRRIADVKFDVLSEGIKLANIQSNAIKSISPQLLTAVKNNLGHPDALIVLATICKLSVGDSDREPDEEFGSAAGLIVEHFVESPDIAIVNFCEYLGGLSKSPSWAHEYETHLRKILAKNRDRFVRASATIALASVVEAAGEERQAEAQELFRSFLDQFDGKTEYNAMHIEKSLVDVAQRRLANLETVGKSAPEIEGLDLNGKSLKLSEYRGKVVLLSFWATWCNPCVKMIPHERELSERFKDRPFVILGVNGDETVQAANAGVTKHKVAWPSFQNRRSNGPSIFDELDCSGWPEFILIDQEGTIRRRWSGEGHQERIATTIESLITAQDK